jgi:hypothetical protein
MDIPNESNDSILNELLGSAISTGSSTANLVRKDDYSRLVAFRNVTSFSMEATLHACPRKFQLLKLGADCNDAVEREGNPDFAFGHAVGAGVATFDRTHDLNSAIWSAFLAWNLDLFASKERKDNRPDPKKSFHHAVWALYLYKEFYFSESDLAEYEVVREEATIAVDFENGYFYVGHIDELLKHRDTGYFKVKENKTTVYGTVDPALYSNSDQGLSYSLVIDSVGASEYSVVYCIYSATEQRWMTMEFTKTALQKVEWLQDHAMIYSTIDMYSDADFFPKRGANCISFGRRCEYYETCDFDTKQVFGKRFGELESAESFASLEAIKPFDFKFKWSEILATQKGNL